MSSKISAKKILTCLMAAFIFSALFAGPLQAAPDAFRVCPKGSEAIIYLNVKALTKFLQSEGLSSGMNVTADRIKTLTTVDILKDVSGFATVLNGMVNYKSNKNPDGAFIFEGYFRTSEIEKKLMAQKIKFEEFQKTKLFTTDDDIVLCAPSEKYLLYGNSAQVKKILALLSTKGDDVLKDEFFAAELALPEFSDQNFIASVKLPDELVKAANVLAKASPDQALFENVRCFSVAAGKGIFVMKYKYASNADAAGAVKKATDFFENGFTQLAANNKKLGESEIDKTKVTMERVSFVRSGLKLLLKMRPSMKIEAKGDSLFIRFSVEQLEKDISGFFAALHTAFIAPIGNRALSPADICADNMKAIDNAALAYLAANKNAIKIAPADLVKNGCIKQMPACPENGEYRITVKNGNAGIECTKHGALKTKSPAETNQ